MAKLAEEVRKHGFWLVDRLKGGPVRRHYREISWLMEVDSQEAKETREAHLHALLQHASTHCAYYADYAGLTELSAFPVVNKTLIKSKMEHFIDLGYSLSKMFSVTTSGSTGTPFQTYQDPLKRARNSADTIYFAGKAGYHIGSRLIYLKIWVREKMRGKSSYWIQNLIPVDVIHLNDGEIASLLKRMEADNSEYGILGYASALELICKYLDRMHAPPVKARVNSVISMSEALNDYTKSTMEKYFGVPVVSRYSNLENGIIAQQETDGQQRFLINSASYRVEILKMDSDEPAGDGQTGRIVVTDLFNRVMPMIRYDTGDIGSLEIDPHNKSLQYLSTVEGRKLDLLFDTSGALISSYLVYKNMWQYPEIDQYQLIQEGAKQYTFKINTSSTFRKDKELLAEFKYFLGADADFRIEYVSEIPLLASGKRRKIVNNYIKD